MTAFVTYKITPRQHLLITEALQCFQETLIGNEPQISYTIVSDQKTKYEGFRPVDEVANLLAEITK